MDSALLEVRVTPRSSREKVELTPEGVKVWVMASPTDGQANEAVQAVLAKRLDLAPSRLTLVRGATGRTKLFRIDGLPLHEVRERLE